jgi:sucrose-6F-phosphate phosphohydrolase
MTDPILFASDLDGTLLPNTRRSQPEGGLKRTQALLQTLLEGGHPVCYVSGRHLSLARKGQKAYRLPKPTYWVCNVGTEIYRRDNTPDPSWSASLGKVFDHAAMENALSRLPGLRRQEWEKLGPHKFSLYLTGAASEELQQEIMARLGRLRDDLRLVHSVEESSGRGLIDILPQRAGKAAALHYLVERTATTLARTFFSGDSGNDLDALVSGVCGTLVGNAPDEVKAKARDLEANSPGARLYVAQAFYGDGVIEGLGHYGLLPQ